MSKKKIDLTSMDRDMCYYFSKEIACLIQTVFCHDRFNDRFSKFDTCSECR